MIEHGERVLRRGVFILMVAAAILPGCGRSAESAADVLRSYYSAGSDQDIDAAAQYLNEDARNNMIDEAGSVEEALSLAAGAGRVESLEILNEFSSVSFARLTFRVHYEDGGSAEHTEVLIKLEDEWKIGVTR